MRHLQCEAIKKIGPNRKNVLLFFLSKKYKNIPSGRIRHFFAKNDERFQLTGCYFWNTLWASKETPICSFPPNSVSISPNSSSNPPTFISPSLMTSWPAILTPKRPLRGSKRLSRRSKFLKRKKKCHCLHFLSS